MPATPEAGARTRAFARVIGPWLVLVPGVIVIRAPEMGIYFSGFFENPLLVWFAGALLIIAFHQYWSSLAAMLISLFGWFLALRGLTLLFAPQLIERVGVNVAGAPAFVQIGFGLLVLAGLWLTFVGWIAAPAVDP